MTVSAAPRPITALDRVSDVLARDEALVEVFVRHAPLFEKLRNRALRRMMSRLVTVEQAARMANVPVEVLVRHLNEAVGIDGGAAPPLAAPVRDPGVADQATRPSGAPVVELDVRDALRAGREPFSAIMAAASALADGDVLHLRTIFEPIPLYAVMWKRGFAHESLRRSDDDWSIWFWRTAVAAAAPLVPLVSVAVPSAAVVAMGRPVDVEVAHDLPHAVWLDVRGLEPPEPLTRTLAALQELPPGRQLVQVNVRVPIFLLPMLAERGFAYALEESHPDYVLLRISRPG